MHCLAKLALILAMAQPCHANTNIITDLTGVPQDKQLHFAAGYIASDALQAITAWARWDPWAGRALALGAGLTLATGKELLDSTQKGNHFDWNDWTATMLGTGINLTLHLHF